MTTVERWELAMAAGVGSGRRINAQFDPAIADRPVAERDAQLWDIDDEGAAAELLVAKTLDRYWEGYVGPVKPHRPDVGRSFPVEVRLARLPTGELVIRPRDDDGSLFVLVTGRTPDQVVRGWLPAGEAKRREWHNPEYPASWRVPQSALRPIEDLVWYSELMRGLEVVRFSDGR